MTISDDQSALAFQLCLAIKMLQLHFQINKIIKKDDFYVCAWLLTYTGLMFWMVKTTLSFRLLIDILETLEPRTGLTRVLLSNVASCKKKDDREIQFVDNTQ